jgi:uncharacterized membrane protein
MKLNKYEKNVFDTVIYLINYYKLRVSNNTIKETLYLHPDFPSLLSISDSLFKWNIKNLASRISFKDLQNTSLPLIAFLEIDGGIFAPIKSVNDNQVIWLDTIKGWNKDSRESFEEKWTNIVLIVEPNLDSGEADFTINNRISFLESFKIPFIISSILISIFLLWFAFDKFKLYISTPQLFLFVIKLFGIFISILLISHISNTDNKIFRTICGNNSENGCNSILNSEASKLFGLFSWSEIGLVYYLSGFIILLFSFIPNFIRLIDYFFVYNILTLPYILFSLYYQRFVVNNWCRLCLIIQFLFGIEFFINLFFIDFKNLHFEQKYIALHLALFLIIIVLWLSIRSPIFLYKKVLPLRREIQKTKFNREYVISLMDKQNKMPPIFDELPTIMLGNKNSLNIITIVTNPFCLPCRNFHKEIESVYEKNANLLSFQFILTGNQNAQKFAAYLFSLTLDKQLKGMNLWYEKDFKSIEEWQAEMEIYDINNEAIKQVINSNRWCEIAEIKATPTIFFNNRELPLLYNLNDLSELIQIFKS